MFKYLLILLALSIAPLYANAQMGNSGGKGEMTRERNSETQTQETDTLEIPSNIDAAQVINNVSQKVLELAKDSNRVGGIGEQVRIIAQEQVKTQEKIQVGLNKLEETGNIFKFLFGQSKDTLEELNRFRNENQQRIEEFKALREQVQDAAEQSTIDETIADLTVQNEVLIEKIQSEETRGVVNWFKNILNSIIN